MHRNQLRTTVLLVAAISALAWVDPLYLPLVLLGPVLGGAVLGARGWPPLAAVLPWVAAGLLIAAIDLAVTGEDLVFHLVLAAFMGLTAAAGVVVGHRLAPRASRATA